MKPHSIDISEKNGLRYLHFGSNWVQGAMRIKRPFDLELAYAQDMMFGLILRAQSPETITTGWPKNVLQIGLGAGSLVKWCHRHLPETKVTAVEINPGVYSAARQFFNLPSDDVRLEVIIGDGIQYLQESLDNWDLILLDGYDAEGRSGALDSDSFYEVCRQKLSDDGLLAVNLLGLARTYEQSLARINMAFEQNLPVLPSCSSGNRIVFGGRKDLRSLLANLSCLHQLADALKERTNLSLHPLLERIA
jgi:spermidine synthase